MADKKSLVAPLALAAGAAVIAATQASAPPKVLRVVAQYEDVTLGAADGALAVMSPDLVTGGIRIITGVD